MIINAVGTVNHHRQSSSHPRTARDAEFSTQLAVNQLSIRSVSEMTKKEHFAGSSSSATATENRDAIDSFMFEENIGRSNLNKAVGSSGSFADGSNSSSDIPYLVKSAQLQLAAGHQLFQRTVSSRTTVRYYLYSSQEGQMQLAAAGHHLETQHTMQTSGICSWYSTPSFVSSEPIVKLQLVQPIIIDCVSGKTVVSGALQKLQLAQ